MNKATGVVVSVCCITYNQQKSIREALDSFLAQKTSFDFEVLVHDDASTDGTTEILREYERKHDNVTVFYEEENRFISSGGWYVDELMLPAAGGEFVAMCEGDDYWTDPDKLELQYAYMGQHDDCALCVHAARVVSGAGQKDAGVLGVGDREQLLSTADLLEQWALPTSSFFFRKADMLEFHKDWDFYMPVGDLTRAVYLSLKGSVSYSPKTMSTYRFALPDSWTATGSQTQARQLSRSLEWLDMLDNMNVATENQFRASFLCNAKRKVLQIAKQGGADKITSPLGREAYESLELKDKVLLGVLRVLWAMGFDVRRTGWGGVTSWKLARHA